MPAEMGINMNYAEIKYCDIANGPGVRTSLFVSGCTHHCPGCFNEIAWDFEYGKPFTQETIDAILASLEPGYIAGLTLLGGEPFEYANQQGLLPLLQQTKSLKNSTFAESAEGVTASFGLPARGEMDPTSVMSRCYVFFFGLMLSDAAYGLIVFLACFILLKKFPRMGSGLKKSIRLFMYCGVSTLFWGVMFGGYFGDAVNVISRTFFGREISIPAVWFTPLDDPMKMLVMSMLFGVIHLFLGLGLKGYMLLKDKRILDFFCDVVLWYCLLTGLILILLPSELFASMSQMTIVFPEPVNLLAKVLAIGGAAGILLMSGRSSKNPALRLALGAYDLYNITSWLSDVLSYSRLLALGLATGVIASVINQMGSMAGNGILGAVVFILVFLVGHGFNLAINLLGAYVHTCRLQYVEFFGKFYEGGGRMFEPFRRNTKYADIKED